MNITRARMRRLRELLVSAAESLPDEEAVEAMEFYNPWQAGTWYDLGTRLRHEGQLYAVRQGHTSMEIYPPGTQGTEALYERIPKPGEGESPDLPIPYNGNMALEQAKYYAQDGVVYICTRDTVNPVYADLSDLVGLYVEVWAG